MSNISLITKLGLIVTTVGTLTVGVRYTSNYNSIEEAINELKDRGVAYYNLATSSKEELEELQSKYDNLSAIYSGVLDKLALEEGATIEEIKTKIDSMVSAGNTDTLNAIGALIGLEAPVTADNVTQALNNMNEQLTTLETKVSTLEAELEQAKLDLQQANTDQQNITALLETCMAEIPAIEEEPGGTVEPGDPVEPPVNPEPEYPVEDQLTEEQQALKATMETKWQAVDTELSKLTGITESEKEAVKAGNYDINSSKGYKAIYVNDKELGMVKYALETALEAYETARTAFINAGGEL